MIKRQFILESDLLRWLKQTKWQRRRRNKFFKRINVVLKKHKASHFTDEIAIKEIHRIAKIHRDMKH